MHPVWHVYCKMGFACVFCLFISLFALCSCETLGVVTVLPSRAVKLKWENVGPDELPR